MPLFRRARQIAALEEELNALKARMQRAESDRSALSGRVSDMQRQVDHAEGARASVEHRLAELPPPGTAQSIGRMQASLAQLDARQAEVDRLLADLRHAIDDLTSNTAADRARIEARLGEVSTQLRDQLDEIGRDVDVTRALAQSAADRPGVAPELIEGITAAQTRLAGEQVRYDLALRAELAELADRLRRSGR